MTASFQLPTVGETKETCDVSSLSCELPLINNNNSNESILMNTLMHLLFGSEITRN